MRRREFLALSAGVAASAAIQSLTRGVEVDPQVKITRIVGFDLPSQRVKLVGKNARLDVHGNSSRDAIVRIYASDGSDGFGYCRLDEKKLAPLLGKSPASFLDTKTMRVNAMGAQTTPMWDLLGKMARKPVYQLLNSAAPTGSVKVAVYDGSVYFSDLLDEYANRWQDRFREEVDEILSRGHRAFKVKIGRGDKWMDRTDGDARDIEVLKVLRKQAGPDVSIGVDANNGYDLERTKRLIDALPDFNFAFIEEMFEENVEQDLKLKEFLRERKLKTLVADGETQPNVEGLKPLMAAGAVDLYQLDINQVGIDGLMEEATLCKPTGGRLAPHTWGTLTGFYSQLHVARAIDNWYSGEQDPLSSPALVAEGYAIKNGMITVPDTPGFGLTLDATKLADFKVKFDLKA